MTKIFTGRVLVAAAMFTAVAMPVHAGVVSLSVPGYSDPWLAGMPNGSNASVYDYAPYESPAEVTGLGITPGSILTFSVTGSVNFSGGAASDPPDGNANLVESHFVNGAQNGISDYLAPIDSLLGVFLGPNQPNFSAAPGSLDFSTPADRDYLTLSPALKQVFFIGDGQTSGNVAQQIYVPNGATRLFLGTADGYEWGNNSGAFNVTVTSTSPPPPQPVPEPGSLAIVGLASCLGFGWLLARRTKRDRRPA